MARERKAQPDRPPARVIAFRAERIAHNITEDPTTPPAGMGRVLKFRPAPQPSRELRRITLEILAGERGMWDGTRYVMQDKGGPGPWRVAYEQWLAEQSREFIADAMRAAVLPDPIEAV